MHRLAIFASGEGRNTQRFIDYFKDNKDVVIELVISNNKDAGVIKRAEDAGIPVLIIERGSFYNTTEVLNLLKEKIDFIVLAGFLWMIPDNILKTFAGKIVNIHPSLLPKYGGKGMYGMKVHEAVIANKEKESGITIHYVNEKYDEGEIISQAKCPVEVTDTPETLAKRIHGLEYVFYPAAVDRLLNGNIS